MYTVHCKGSEAKEFECERFQVNAGDEPEVVIENYRELNDGKPLQKSKLLKVTVRDRQGTSAYHCTECVITDANGDVVKSLHSDGTAVDSLADKPYDPSTGGEAGVTERTDGPTLQEWTDHGYPVEAYPPKGYTDKRTQAEKDEMAAGRNPITGEKLGDKQAPQKEGE